MVLHYHRQRDCTYECGNRPDGFLQAGVFQKRDQEMTV